MSLDATRWAWKQDIRPMAKLVLLSLADRAGEQHEAWPTVARIESDTGMDRKTIMAWTKFLEQEGLISVERVAGIGNVYRLVGVSDRHTENARPVPKTGLVKNGTSPKNGTPTSPKNGTPTSPKNGTQNLSIEPTKESTNTNTDIPVISEAAVLTPATVCRLLSDVGVFGVNPTDPDLVALLEMGVTAEKFVEAGRVAVDERQGRFRFVLGIVKNRLCDAQAGVVGSFQNFGGGYAGNRKSGVISRAENSVNVGRALDNIVEEILGREMGGGLV